jgi:aminoglycoside phosphotransferase (APT) family kinase protein
LLRTDLSEINIKLESQKIISAAFDYIYVNISCLEYQTGAKLLHNDFHPKNIIVHEGRLAGIIDWECSQFGEADFELAHLFHWCIYPPEPGKTFGLLLKSIVENLRIASDVPNIEKRLTIYQLEHELNQLIWSGGNQEEERMRRINGWLNGQIEVLLEQWQV